MAVSTEPVVKHGAWQTFIMGDGVMLNAGGVTTVKLMEVLNVQPKASVTVNPSIGFIGTPLKA